MYADSHTAVPTRFWLGRRLAVAVIATMAAAVGLGFRPATAGSVPESFAPIVKELLPTVVNISTRIGVDAREPSIGLPGGAPLDEFFRRFFGGGQVPGPRRVSALGSGFIISPDGYVVTNNHVVKGAEEITVILADNRSYPAEVRGRDAATDLALLKLDADDPLPAVEWGDSDKTEVGDWVVAIGNPFGLGGTVTAGIISARARDLRAGPYDDFLQTDASINRGNSGGPMFDGNGRVIGVNTAIFSPSGGNVGIGFATPSAVARPVIEQLRRTGQVRRGWIGIEIQPVTAGMADAIGLLRPRGALVADVMPGGPADEAGVRPGDVITGFAGRDIETFRDLPRVVAGLEPGRSFELTVVREQRQRKFTIEVGNRKPVSREAIALAVPPGGAAAPSRIGMHLGPLDADLRRELGFEGPDGVAVLGVEPGSIAMEHGIRGGDVIVEAAGNSVERPGDVKAAIEAARQVGRRAVLVRLYRNGSFRYLALPVG